MTLQNSTKSNGRPAATAPESSGPWWKYGHVWLVIAGPAIVVLASLVTLWLAVSRPDPVLSEDYYQRGIEINKTLRAAGDGAAAAREERTTALMPALKARNHAAAPAAVAR